jgi:hypothetical protein
MKTKQLLLSLFALVLFAKSYAQAPLGIPYQAAARKANGQALTNTAIKVRFSILDSTASGTVAFKETHITTTNALGMFNLNVGMGTAITGTLAGVKWANNAKFLQVELDTTATGNNYMLMGIQQLMSVPYALFAAGPIGGFTHYIGETYNDGIVFYLYRGSDGLEHGLMVALSESSTSLVWQTTNFIVNASSFDDGAYNTNLINNSPAKTYVASLGSGWYMPSIDELSLLYRNRFAVQKALRAGNYMQLTSWYWSSTEYGSWQALMGDFEFGVNRNEAKSVARKVRGIRAF